MSVGYLWSLESAGGALVCAAEEAALFAAPDGDSAAVGAVHLDGLLLVSDLPATGDACGHTYQPRYNLGSIFKC